MAEYEAGTVDAEATGKRLSDRLSRIVAAAANDIKGREYQRRMKRRATAHLGQIETPDGRQIDCNILELTDMGMRIGLRSDYAPPPRFFVRIPALRARYAVSLKWTSHGVLGAEIIAPLPAGAAAAAFGETCRRFLKDEGGATAIEYALMTGIAALALIYGARVVSGGASEALSAAAHAMAAPGPETTEVRARDRD